MSQNKTKHISCFSLKTWRSATLVLYVCISFNIYFLSLPPETHLSICHFNSNQHHPLRLTAWPLGTSELVTLLLLDTKGSWPIACDFWMTVPRRRMSQQCMTACPISSLFKLNVEQSFLFSLISVLFSCEHTSHFLSKFSPLNESNANIRPFCLLFWHWGDRL